MWQIKQLERLYEVEPETVDTVMNELLEKKSGLREKLVIGAYLDGDINFGKAAELLDTHPIELRERFLAKGIPVRLGVESIEEMLAEGTAARRMREAQP
jgi:predicted HTH domain antitoxin